MIPILKKIFEDQGGQILFAYLFGSHARGDATADSDIDIAIFLDPQLQMEFFDIKTALYLEISRSLKMNDIDIVVLNRCKNIILLDRITRHGQVIYESNQDARLDFEQKVLHTAIDFKYQRKRVMGV
jgi:predicted nucleotidyltransferase